MNKKLLQRCLTKITALSAAANMPFSYTKSIISDIESELAKPEQEPVGYVTLDGEFVPTSDTVKKHGVDCGKNLYTSPQSREPLSEDDGGRLMAEQIAMIKVDKKTAGRLLDGLEHNGVTT